MKNNRPQAPMMAETRQNDKNDKTDYSV